MKKLNYLFCLFVFASPILNINIASASSGACSYHGGVNCSVGADTDGSVICNDGWTDSSVSYSSMSECRSSSKCPMYLSQADYDKQKQEIQNSINKVQNDNQTMCQGFLNSDESRNEQSYQVCVKSRQSMMNIAGSVSAGLYANTNDCEDVKTKQSEYNKTKYNSCLYNSQDTIFKYQTLLSCLAVDHTDYCKVKYPNTHTENNNCVCDSGYTLTSGGCVLPQKCSENFHLGDDGQCVINNEIIKDESKWVPTDNPFASVLSKALKETKVATNTVVTKKESVIKSSTKLKKATLDPAVINGTTTVSVSSATTSASTTPITEQKTRPNVKWYKTLFAKFFKS